MELYRYLIQQSLPYFPQQFAICSLGKYAKNHLTWLTYVWPSTNPFSLHTGLQTIQNTGVFWQAVFQMPRPTPFFGSLLHRQNFNHTPRQYRQLGRLIGWLWWQIKCQGCAVTESSGPLAPNFCSWASRKSWIFYTNHMQGTLDFTGSEHWATFNFP